MLTKEKDLALIQSICSKLDYSMALVPNATEELVIKACEDAKLYRFAAVPVFSDYTALVARELAGTGIATELTVGFPSGGVATAVKAKETEEGLLMGATEVDMVMNIGRLCGKEYSYVEKDIRSVVEIAAQKNVEVKVIIETGYLNDAQKRDAVEIIASAGAAFVKTCTGFGPGCANLHDIELLVQQAKGRLKVKASGGITTLEDGLKYIEAGVSRIAGRQPIVDQLKGLEIFSF